MKTQIVYVLVSSEQDYYLEELWISLFSLRQFHPQEKVLVLADAPTAARIKDRPEMDKLISELRVVPVPEDYSGKFRSREIKTSVRNLIEGDFLFIDTDTVITAPLDEVDTLSIKNLAMVPELHGPFKQHMFYQNTVRDVKRIFDVDVSDSPYWFNSGCMFVRDNDLTREFFRKWNANWKHSAFNKGNSSDQRALLCTDKGYGYIIECLPDVFNCQVAMTIQYLQEAKIVHFWHMRASFTPDLDYSPYCNKTIYKKLHQNPIISETIESLIVNCKSTFNSPSMLVGKAEIYFLFSSFYVVLGRAYHGSKFVRWWMNWQISLLNFYYRGKRKLMKKIKA